MGGHPLLLEWNSSAMISRIVWEFVEGFLERISRLFGSGGGRKSVPTCHCPWEKRDLLELRLLKGGQSAIYLSFVLLGSC